MQDAKPAAKKAKAEDDSAAQGSSTVFVKNLPWSATDEDLANFFADCGEVAEVRIGALCRLILQLSSTFSSSGCVEGRVMTPFFCAPT